MIINFLGDSITAGACASSYDKSFVALLAKKYPNHVIRNYGVGGTRIARQNIFYESDIYHAAPQDESLYCLDFNARSVTMINDADYVFVFGGTNDFGHGSAPIGKKSDKTPYTFYGALNTLFNYLNKTYGKGKIFFILPLPRFDMDSTHGSYGNFFTKSKPTLNGYIDIIKERAEHYKVTTLDFSKEFDRPKANENKGLFADGLHPNDKGYRLLADLLSKVIDNLK